MGNTFDHIPHRMSDVLDPEARRTSKTFTAAAKVLLPIPKCFMYGIFTYIGVVFGVNVGIHGVYGIGKYVAST